MKHVENQIKRIAHRGSSGHITENSLASIELAIQQGANMVEIDCQCVEGKVVVFHDLWIRQEDIGISKPVSNCTVDEFNYINKRREHPIPTLEEVFDLVKGRVPINVEVKTSSAFKPITKILANLSSEDLSRIIVSSFLHPELTQFSQVMPDVALGLLVAHKPTDISKLIGDLNIASFNTKLHLLDACVMSELNKLNIDVWVYVVNERIDYDTCVDLGVAAVFTDFPDRVLSWQTQPTKS